MLVRGVKSEQRLDIIGCRTLDAALCHDLQMVSNHSLCRCSGQKESQCFHGMFHKALELFREIFPSLRFDCWPFPVIPIESFWDLLPPPVNRNWNNKVLESQTKKHNHLRNNKLIGLDTVVEKLTVPRERAEEQGCVLQSRKEITVIGERRFQGSTRLLTTSKKLKPLQSQNISPK